MPGSHALAAPYGTGELMVATAKSGHPARDRERGQSAEAERDQRRRDLRVTRGQR